MLLPLNGAGAVQRYATPPLRTWMLPFHPPLKKINWQLALTVKTVPGFWKAVSMYFIPILPLVRVIPATFAPTVVVVHSPYPAPADQSIVRLCAPLICEPLLRSQRLLPPNFVSPVMVMFSS